MAVGLDTVVYSLLKKYTDNSIRGITGALAGKNCTIESVSKQDGLTTVTFKWTADDGTVRRTQIEVEDGTPIYTWTSGNHYEYGDLVIYASMFYRCITDNSDVEFDDTKWNELGSPDGNYDIVQDVEDLPVRFTAADRKLYYVISESDFYLWNGHAWIKVMSNSLEELEDVDLNDQAEGEVVVWDSVNEKWVNRDKHQDYPDYMKDERDAVLAKLLAFYDIKNPIIIGFNTDQHLSYHSNGTPSEQHLDTVYGIKALRDITKKYPFNLCVLGGDCNGTLSVLQEEQSAKEVYSSLDDASCPIVSLIGNHDAGQNYPLIPSQQVFNFHFTKSNKDKYMTVADNSNNCYYDDPSCNVRFIFLQDKDMNGYPSDLTKQFLANSLETLPQGYETIIFSHHPLGDLPDDPSTRVDDWNNPLNWSDVVDPYADKIIACICGHVHCDKSTILHGILYLSTTTAGNYELNDGSTRTPGTSDATAYDVFVIDRDINTIHCVRFGNGSDRNVVYRTTSYTNVIPTSIDAEGNVYNEIGYKDGYRLNSSGVEVSDTIGHYNSLTGYIPATNGDIIELKGCNFSSTHAVGTLCQLFLYDSSFTKIAGRQPAGYNSSGDEYNHLLNVDDQDSNILRFTVPRIPSKTIAYIRLQQRGSFKNSTITVNDPIYTAESIKQPIQDDGTDIDFTNWEV